MAVSFIYFDAGFTLLRPYPSVGYHYAEIAQEYGLCVKPEEIDAAFRPAWKAALALRAENDELPYGRNMAEARVFWNDVIDQCFLQVGVVPPEAPEFQIRVFNRFAKAACWRLYDDVEPALALLAERGVGCGVLSNWDPRLRMVLEDMKITEWFDAIVPSCEVGAEKPKPEIFRAAERACGFGAHEIAMIGDERKADGDGAIAAGWQQCLVLREKTGGRGPDGLRWQTDLLKAVRLLLAE